jgi:hypothetical protein
MIVAIIMNHAVIKYLNVFSKAKRRDKVILDEKP